jgi:hypothetical protein
MKKSKFSDFFIDKSNIVDKKQVLCKEKLSRNYWRGETIKAASRCMLFFALPIKNAASTPTLSSKTSSRPEKQYPRLCYYQRADLPVEQENIVRCFLQ